MVIRKKYVPFSHCPLLSIPFVFNNNRLGVCKRILGLSSSASSCKFRSILLSHLKFRFFYELVNVDGVEKKYNTSGSSFRTRSGILSITATYRFRIKSGMTALELFTSLSMFENQEICSTKQKKGKPKSVLTKGL